MRSVPPTQLRPVLYKDPMTPGVRILTVACALLLLVWCALLLLAMAAGIKFLVGWVF